MLTKRLKNIGLGMGLFIVWTIVAIASEEPQRWFLQLSPASILKLNWDWAIGLTVTLVSSLVAFSCGVAGGYIAGLCVSSTLIDDEKERWSHGVGRNLDRIFDGIYVIPLVLTLSLFYASGLSFTLKHNLPQWPIVFAMVALAGMTLGGYNVYKSIYEAATNPKRESRLLIHSLFFSKEHLKPWLRRLLWQLVRVKKLRDCEHHSFCEAIKRAFHLSIVAVVILESIIPGFYGNLFQSSGTAPAWVGGVGKLILTARSSNEFQTIAGCIWIILLFDIIWVWLIEKFIHSRWQRYYTNKP